MTTTETIKITLDCCPGWWSNKYGTDENGSKWAEFEVDWGCVDCQCEEDEEGNYPDECMCGMGECVICGAMIESGWICLDGGDEVCSNHIDYEYPDDSHLYPLSGNEDARAYR